MGPHIRLPSVAPQGWVDTPSRKGPSASLEHHPIRLRLPRPDQRARLTNMPGADVPVIRQPFGPADPVPFWPALGPNPTQNRLFDLDDDRYEQRDRSGTHAEAEAVELLRRALDDVAAPDEQSERLGLE